MKVFENEPESQKGRRPGTSDADKEDEVLKGQVSNNGLADEQQTGFIFWKRACAVTLRARSLLYDDGSHNGWGTFKGDVENG